MFALFTVVLVGLSVMGANLQWKTMMQRERESELLYRGDQYRRAIAAYVEAVPGVRQYPLTVEELLRDSRNSKRYLRAAYVDPVTGKPFETVPCRDRIKGVFSPSQTRTLRRDNFPPEYEHFRSAGSHRDWVFQYEPGPHNVAPAPPGQVGQAPPVAVPTAVPIPC